MSKVVKLGTQEDRLEAASRWLAQMDKGLSAVDNEKLQEWMAAHPKNTKVLLSMTKNWDEMDDLARLAELFPEANDRPVVQRQTTFRLAAAAVVLVAVAVLIWLPIRQANDSADPSIAASATNLYETTVGEQATAILSDGTEVVLNTNSRLRVEYSDRARVLFLERGEIHVDIVPDAARRFSVVAGDRIFQAVGTSFSVEIKQDDQIELVVTEGRVVVGIRTVDDSAGRAPQLLSQSSDNTVAAGEEIVLGASNESIISVSPEEIEVKLAWREGRLIFRGETLEAALAEVERYTTVEFIFLEQDLKSRAVTGRFRAGDVDSLLAALRMNFNIVSERSDDGRVLLSSL